MRSFFLVWFRFNWDPPQPLLCCVLSFCYCPGLPGNQPTFFFLCSHVLFFWFGSVLTGTCHNLCSHVFFLYVLVRAYLGPTPTSSFSALMCSFFLFCFRPNWYPPHPELSCVLFYVLVMFNWHSPKLFFLCS